MSSKTWFRGKKYTSNRAGRFIFPTSLRNRTLTGSLRLEIDLHRSEMSDSLVLSRFFNDNCNFVAGMCPKCYEECQDIRIISINMNFLKQFHRKIFNKIVKEPTFGFTSDEIDYSVRQFEKVQNFLKIRKITLGNIEEVEENVLQSNSIQNGIITYKTNQKIYLRGLKEISKEQKKKWRKYNAIHDGKESKYFHDVNKNTVKNKATDIILQTTQKKYAFDNEVKDSKTKQEEFITNFLITDFEFKYLKHQKQRGTSSWIPPRSPHNLIEESLYTDPWALLVATIFLNRTSCVVARPYVFWFLSENPDPLTVLDKFPSDLEKYFVNIGLRKTRAVQIYRMSYEFLFKPWKNVSQLFGIGEYGECAYRMFCLGDFTVQPKDRFLKIYKAWYDKLLNQKL
ncbi:uncharacterized protein LOC130903745 [Diorhabda carinulata]|uniref:uncharacterized protein LOC130903745 n=1 Tax=Diorhabda carinulata TaxID=1163345 RepID=UPI0025A1098A|nr:uncharacterized protein LOC130903745 [Diorhabda carinulata]